MRWTPERQVRISPAAEMAVMPEEFKGYGANARDKG